MQLTTSQYSSLVNLLSIAERSLQASKLPAESEHERAVASVHYLRAVKALNEADSVLKRRSAFTL